MRRLVLFVAAAAALAASGNPFTFVDAGGRSIAVRPEPGQPLLLHFWATWCADCAEDLDHLGEAAASCGSVRVYAVNAGDAEAQVKEFTVRHALRLPMLRDPSGEAWRRLDARGLPMNAWWTASGHETDVGPKTREQWKQLLAMLGCS